MTLIDDPIVGEIWDGAERLELLAAASVLYAYASLNIESDVKIEASRGFPRERVQAALEGQVAAPFTAEQVTVRAELAWSLGAASTVVEMRIGDYDLARAQINASAGRVPVPGQLSWPVSTGTIRQALGGESGKWTTALERLGLAAGSPGKPRGSVRWTDEQLESAWANYGSFIKADGGAPSIPGYEQWREGSEVSAPSIGTLINRLGDHTWRGLRELIAAPAPAAPADEPSEVKAQRSLLEVQKEYVAQLEVRKAELETEVIDGVAGATETLQSHVSLLVWAKLSVETQLSVIEIEASRSKQAAEESRARIEQATAEGTARRRGDVGLGIGVIAGTILAAFVGPLWTSFGHLC